MDTCQPCCDCDCNTSASAEDPENSKTCNVLLEFGSPDPPLSCADHGHAETDSGKCDTEAVEAACELICNPTTTTATTTTQGPTTTQS